ncbi:class F sortase [Streptomyces sp. F63]|uniref:class F sortase n=1 Tax=Streptomyces sp. F63 TaxID=2824887 RepID=UPI0027DDE223|nr:class F sortase [Streptomyces sp. F63]
MNRGRKRALFVFVFVVVSATLVGLILTVQSRASSDEAADAAPPAAPGNGAAQGGESPAGGPAGDAKPLGASRPQQISIPKLGVTSTLEKLNLGADGEMKTPRDPFKAGWYEPGPAPGAMGPAVIAGHVTWNGEPSVFHKLSTLKQGDRIEVAREDGRTAEFTVDRIGQYPKDKFPTVEVYRNLDHAGLRLITCGGEFSESDNRYSDNVVVFASLAGSRA